MVTEAAAVKKAKEEYEGENRVAVAVNPHEEGTPHWNYLTLHPLFCHRAPPLEKPCRSHLSKTFHLSNVPTHLPFQVHHPHPPRCSGVYHLKLLNMFRVLLWQGLALVSTLQCLLYVKS